MNKKEEFPKVYLYRRIVFAKLFIDNHFAEKINLDHIAGEASFSKYHFIRQFADIYKKTPHQYLSHVRLQKAMRLLTVGMAVEQACYAVGFESVSSFSGLFKRTTGLSPSTFRSKQLEKANAMQKVPLSFIPNCFAVKNGWVVNDEK